MKEKYLPEFMPSSSRVIMECLRRKTIKIHFVGLMTLGMVAEDTGYSVYRVTFLANKIVGNELIGMTHSITYYPVDGYQTQTEHLNELVERAYSIGGEFIENDPRVTSIVNRWS